MQSNEKQGKVITVHFYAVMRHDRSQGRTRRKDQWVQPHNSVHIVALRFRGRYHTSMPFQSLVDAFWGPLMEAHPLYDPMTVGSDLEDDDDTSRNREWDPVIDSDWSQDFPFPCLPNRTRRFKRHFQTPLFKHLGSR